MPAPTPQIGKQYILTGLGRVTVVGLTQRHVDFMYSVSLRHSRMARGKFRSLIDHEYVAPVI
jgi:hypothetical protein